jgi:hypothetical protein
VKLATAPTGPAQIGPALAGPARTKMAQVLSDAPSCGARPPVHRRPPVYLAQATTVRRADRGRATDLIVAAGRYHGGQVLIGRLGGSSG